MFKKNKKNKSKLINALKEHFNRLKSNPKKYFKDVITHIKNTILNNKAFTIYVVLTLLASTLLRFVTVKNFFAIKPMLADLAIILLVGSFGYLKKPNRRGVYYIICNIILTLLCFINSVYYTFYSSFVSVSLLETSKFLGQMDPSVTTNVFQVKDFIYFIPSVILICYYIHLNKNKYKELKVFGKNFQKFKHVMIGTIVVAFIFLINITGLEISRFVKQWNREYIVTQFGVYTYQINDIIQSFKPKVTSLFGYDKAVKTFNDYYKDASDTSTSDNKYTDIFKGKNILAIHAESIQNFVLGLEFNGEQVAPNLTRIANEGLYFDNFYTQVSVGTSSDSEFTLNTSLMPSSSGTVFVSYFDREYNSIPKSLKKEGYYAFSMHANTGDFWNRNVMHKSLGYDKFYSKSSFDVNKDNSIGLGLSDKKFYKQAIPYLKKIDSKDKPYYGTIISLSNHTPFDAVDKYGEFDLSIHETNEDGEEVTYPYLEGTKLGNYIKSVHYADEAYGELFQMLEDEGLIDNTVVVIYGDHDAKLSRNEFVKMYNYDKETDGILDQDDENYADFDNYKYELNRKTPFIIWTKDSKNNKTLNKKVSNVMGMYDVMPTLGNMFGFYNKYALGHDMFEIGENNIVVFPNSNFVTNKVYYNSQKGEYLALTDTVISDEYIDECNEYASKLLDVSNDVIVYDLIKKEEDKENKYTEEVTE